MTTAGPQIPWTARLGTIAEAKVKARLAYFSIVTKYETDPGLDFYCELLENDSPSLPFYVQAKGTEHFDDSWGASIPKPTLLYWLRQPSPVYLALHDEKDDVCYWMSVEELRYALIERIVTTDAATVYVRVHRRNVLEQGRDHNSILISRIKEDTSLVQLYRGHAAFQGSGYVKRLPPPPRADLEITRIKESVRAGLYSVVQHCLSEADIDTAKVCCDFLARFDTSHYNHFAWLGRINAVMGDLTAARVNLQRAVAICEADKEWPSESMQLILDSLNDELRKLGGSRACE